MKIAGIIPARYASTRFPGKPLVNIQGKSMIRRVYEQCLKCPQLDAVVVATDDERILDVVNSFGGHAMMTSTSHQSGTDRCGEVIEKLEKQGEAFDAVINIQGDEPFIDPGQISKVALQLIDDKVQIATLVKRIDNTGELFNPNVVKVVLANDGRALYFSRSTIPHLRGHEQKEWLGQQTFYKHVGIYGYQTEILKKIITLPRGNLELAESLEQLRWLENGFLVFAEETDFESIAIDTPEDLSKIFKI
jgi:3-deoxy-manno-octulosonate cytidylyltransferase (CMP-KDO synthetase)